MTTAIIRHEPLGIVIQDGGPTAVAPKIMMWFWASENDVPEWEK